jgi:hypothetical protein
VLHAHVAALEVVRDLLFQGEFAYRADLLRRLDVLVGREVVADQGHAVAIEDLLGTHGPKGLDGQGGGDVVGQYEVDAAADDAPGFRGVVGRVGLQDFFR